MLRPCTRTVGPAIAGPDRSTARRSRSARPCRSWHTSDRAPGPRNRAAPTTCWPSRTGPAGATPACGTCRTCRAGRTTPNHSTRSPHQLGSDDTIGCAARNARRRATKCLVGEELVAPAPVDPRRLVVLVVRVVVAVLGAAELVAGDEHRHAVARAAAGTSRCASAVAGRRAPAAARRGHPPTRRSTTGDDRVPSVLCHPFASLCLCS